MKKNLLILATAALAMTACSNDETLEVNRGNSIAFRSAVDSRATEMTTPGLQKFYVSAISNGLTFMDNVLFEKKDGSVFKSTPEYNWPSGKVNFYAYSPSLAELGLTAETNVAISAEEAKFKAFSPNVNIANQADFITAKALEQEEKKSDDNTESVELTFNHNLAQIEIKAKTDNENYIYKILGVKIAKVKSKGTFNFTNGEWSDLAFKGTDESINVDSYIIYFGTTEDDAVELTPKASEATSLMTATSGNAMLLPQQLAAWDGTESKEGSYLAILVNITTKSGGQIYPATEGKYNWMAVGIGENWQAGKHYCYTLDLTNGAGTVPPERPGDLDPTDVDPTDPGKDPEVDPIDPDKDPFKPGQELLGGPITFTATVSPWTSGSTTL
ncbi:MAG: fimbrillin family protein [Muribaculum sp.]|nr:fimbrillin family protein [Muribaculum sp.]